MKFMPQNQLPPALRASSDAVIAALRAKYGNANLHAGMVMHNAAGFFRALQSARVPDVLSEYAARFLSETITELGQAIGADPEKSMAVAQALLANTEELAAELLGNSRDDSAERATVAAEAAAAMQRAGWTPRVINGGVRPEDIN